jgi:hypothetical protein
MSNFTNVTGFETLISQGNTISGGWLGYSLIITIFCILGMSSLPYGRNKAIVFASFTSGILAAFMTINGLVGYWIVVILGIIFAGSFFMLIQNRQTAG